MQDFDDDLHVDLTPLIDVIFMLVIFFIMTMSFTLPVVEFTLPESVTAQNTAVSERLRLEVKADGALSIAGVAVSFEEAENAVKQKAAETEGLSLELLIDAQAPAEFMIKAADLSRIYTGGRLLVISERTEKEKTEGQKHTVTSGAVE